MQYNPWSFSIYNKTDRTDKTRVIRIRPEYANLTMSQQIYTVGRVNDLSANDKTNLFVMLGCKSKQFFCDNFMHFSLLEHLKDKNK